MKIESSPISALKEQIPGLTTGDRIAPPPPGKAKAPRPVYEPLRPLEVEEWPSNRLAAFEILSPVALYIASAERPVSVALLARDGSGEVWADRWIGGNPNLWEAEDLEGRRRNAPRGTWPVKLGLAHRYKDTITRTLDKDPYVKLALRRRIWVLDAHVEIAGERVWGPAWLLSAAQAGFAQAAEDAGFAQLLNGYVDAGPRFSPYGFETRFVAPLAAEHGIKVWSEHDLGRFLHKAMKRAAERKITRHQEAAFRDLCLNLVEEGRSKAQALAVDEEVHRHAPTASAPPGWPSRT